MSSCRKHDVISSRRGLLPKSQFNTRWSHDLDIIPTYHLLIIESIRAFLSYVSILSGHNFNVSLIMSRSRVPPILRPRLTPKYIASSVVAIYVLYCWLWGMPLLSSNLPAYTGPHSVGTIDIESPCDGRKTSDVKFKSNGQPAFLVRVMYNPQIAPTDHFRSWKQSFSLYTTPPSREQSRTNQNISGCRSRSR